MNGKCIGRNHKHDNDGEVDFEAAEPETAHMVPTNLPKPVVGAMSP